MNGSIVLGFRRRKDELFEGNDNNNVRKLCMLVNTACLVDMKGKFLVYHLYKGINCVTAK